MRYHFSEILPFSKVKTAIAPLASEIKAWKLFLPLVLAVTLVDVGQDYFFSIGRKKEVYWPQILLFSTDWLLWLLLIPACRWSFFRFRDLKRSKSIGLWTGVAALTCGSHLILKAAFFHIVWSNLGHASLFANVFFKMAETIHITVVAYVTILVVLYLISENPVLAREKMAVYQKLFPVKNREGVRMLETSEICWFQANDNYVWIHCNAEKYLVDNSLSHLEKVLDPALFMRIHRSSIVNTSKIRTVGFHADDPSVTLTNGSKIKYSKTYKNRLFQKLKLDGVEFGGQS